MLPKLLTLLLIPLLLLLIPQSLALNILLNNDDGFGASNIREFYRLLVASNHTVYMVAPAVDNSGQGGRLVFTTSSTLNAPSEFNLIPAGAPSLGQDPHDSHIWYYNGTPAACTLIGLDYVLPNHASFSVPDLFVSGPNFGDNIGTFAYAGSGTIGATYTAIYHNVPGIAFSAANPTLSYTNLTNTTNPSTYAAQQAVKLVNLIAKNTKLGSRILPLGYGLNVNIPPLNSTCMNPPFVPSRIAGGAGMPKVMYNSTSGLVGVVGNDYFSQKYEGLNQCINGDCGLEGESTVVTGCEVAVSVFSVEYDAPLNAETEGVESLVFGEGAWKGWKG